MPTDTIRTLTRAVAALECFSLEQPELGVREVARQAGLSSSAAGRLLAGLRELGILTQNPETHTYAMGVRPLAWAGVYVGSLDVRNQALPVLEGLRQVTRETISLYVLDGFERVCVERLESTQSVRIVARLGRRLPLYAGAAGKVLLAYMPQARREEFFANVPLLPLTPRTVTDPHGLQADLDQVRADGCAVSFGEWIEDAAGVAAPVLDQNGEALAALTISGPILRFTPENVSRYRSEALRVAAQISTQMGYSTTRRYS